MKIFRISILACVLLLLAKAGFGQNIVRRVSSTETDQFIPVIHGPHLVMVPVSRAIKKKLVVSIVGTGDSAEGMFDFDSVAASQGYHTVSLDYKNQVITTVCRPSLDSLCFDKFRQEIVFGTPVSDSVRVDSMNSIYNRLFYLLKYLSNEFPKEGWASYFKDNTINWSSIIVVGHSQGAGHAAFLGKHFQLNKVIILAGPQDYRDPFESPALWIGKPGKTPTSRYVALLHQQDPFGFDKQLANCLRLSAAAKTDTASADVPIPKGTHPKILVRHVLDKDAHNSVASDRVAGAWAYLLGQL